MPIIALGHQSRQGKDTLALMLLELTRTCGPEATLVGFAHLLKDVAFKLYGWGGLKHREYYDDPKHAHQRQEVLPALGLTPVQVWVALGAKLAEIHPATLPKAVLDLHDQDVRQLLIIPDLRRPFEAEQIRKMTPRSCLVKVVRSRQPITEQLSAADALLDGFTDWDYLVVNDGSIADLQAKAVELFSRITEPDKWAPVPERHTCPTCYVPDGGCRCAGVLPVIEITGVASAHQREWTNE